MPRKTSPLYFVEIVVFLLLLLLIFWYNQSKLQIVKFITPPKIILETREYFEIEWHTKLLLPNCVISGHPLIYSNYGSEHLPEYSPLYSLDKDQKFIRRYNIPLYLVKLNDGHKNENPEFKLRLSLKAVCNPLWYNFQVIEIPFQIPSK